MKRTEQTARNIFVFDDEQAVGGTAHEPSLDAFNEQPPTAPHPLSHLLTTALNFIATRPDLNDELADNMADEFTDYDDLIPLYDAMEDDVEHDSVSATVSVIDSIADSLNGADDGVKAPLFLSAFKSRFLA